MKYCVLLCALLLSACSSGSKKDNTIPVIEKEPPPGDLVVNLSIPDNQQLDEYKVAIVGNSHTSGLGNRVSDLISQSMPNKKVSFVHLSSGFLVETVADASAQSEFKNGGFTHIVLQGLRYSQSRSTTYPTSYAETWIQRAKTLGVTPILFPEHPQRGDLTEARYVHRLHMNVINNQKACIAPVGLVWDKALQLVPSLTYHAPDGNHAAEVGQYLTSLVFVEAITGQRVDSLSLPQTQIVSPDIQLLFAQITSQVIYDNPACQFDS